MLLFTDKLEPNAKKIEAKLRKELGAPAALPWQADVQGELRPSSMGQLAAELGRDLKDALLGNTTLRPLYTLRFDVTAPRAMEVLVPVVSVKNRIALGGVRYTTRLRHDVDAAIGLQEESERGLLGGLDFVGQGAAAAKLNANKPLKKRVAKLVRDTARLGDLEYQAPRFFTIAPDQGGALLSLQTMPRATWFGMSSSLDAAELLAVAAQLDAVLA